MRTLQELSDTLGSDRRITICRELTKKYEEAYRTTFGEALERYEHEEPKGECVIVIEGKSIGQLKAEQQKSWEEMELAEHMELYLSQGIDRKEAMKLVAKDRGIAKRSSAPSGVATHTVTATPSSASFLEKRRPSVVPLNTTAFTYGTPAA